MNKLWLSAIAATCLVVGSAAQAGDRHGNGHGDYHNSYHAYHDEGGHGSRHRDWYDHRGWHRADYYPVAYVYPVVYGRPGYYQRPVYSRPANYAHIYGGSNGQIHGSISVGF